MKQMIIFSTLIFALGASACKRTETCDTYTKNTKAIKTDKATI